MLADPEAQDPIAFRRVVDLLLGAAEDAPLPVSPPWPGTYPAVHEPSLFHVTPFGPAWASETMKAAAEACSKRDPAVAYVRGDQVLDPNVIRSIWDRLCRASYVLADLTSLNANVALELGMAHVLGRNVLLVSQDEGFKRFFPAIAKARVHGYQGGRNSGEASLGRLVARFLNETDARIA
jgi:hypothetical protein